MGKLTDESPMPWGKYKGDKMIDVPAYYLMWLYENKHYSKDVKEYIDDNLDVLKEEIKRSRKE